MEAKDTVMKPNDMKDAMRIPIKSSLCFEADIEDFERLVKTQAEISFKAGFIEGQADKGHNEAILQVANESRKAGIREVIEWMDSKESVGRTNLERLLRFAIFRDDWDQLKEWGIDGN